MHLEHLPGVNVIIDQSIIAISPDGYIRLTFEEFRHISLVHLISGIDEDKPVLLQEGATFTEITGYTEWVSDTMPTISIGWDWIIQPLQAEKIYYKRVSAPRSNLMLVDAQQRDLGSTRTITLIEIVLDKIAWQSVTHAHISTRYVSRPVNIDSCY